MLQLENKYIKKNDTKKKIIPGPVTTSSRYLQPVTSDPSIPCHGFLLLGEN